MPEDFEGLNLGLIETDELGSYSTAEKFLSADAKDLEEIDEDAELEKAEVKKKADAEAKKKATSGKTIPKEGEISEEEKAEKERLDKLKKDPLSGLEDETEEEELDENGKPKAKKETDKEELDENGKPKKKEDLNTFQAFAKDLITVGAFSELQDGESLPDTAEKFLAKINSERQQGAVQWLDNFLSTHGEDRREMFEAIFINGVDPKEYLPVFNRVQSFEGLDLTKEDNQKAVFREFYKRIGWDADKVEKKLTKTVDYGDLESEATDYHTKLIEQDKEVLEDLQESRKEQTRVQQELDNNYKLSVQKALSEAVKKKEVAGYPLNDQQARETFDFLYTKKYKTPEGQLLTEFDKFILESKKPENIQDRVLIALLKNSKFDFSRIKKQAVTDETNTLFQTVQKQTVKKNRPSAQSTEKSNTSSWMI